MAKARKILDRTRAVKSIRTVTRTMEMVASSRFRKTFDQAVATRPYTDRLSDLVADVLSRGVSSRFGHPLLKNVDDVRRDVLMVLTSNRGLCGGYNQSVIRVAMSRMKQIAEEGYEVRLHAVGKRGVQYFRFRGFDLDRAHMHFDGLPDYHAVGELAEELMQLFLAGLIGGVEIAYTQFLSSSRQKPVISQILPLENLAPPPDAVPTWGERVKYEFLPSGEEVLRNLLPATVRLRVYQCFLDAAVSEQVARIAAMRAATENADEMIRDLTIRYNRLRQTQITTELAEILGGRVGLE